MSTGADCNFYEKERGKWYYELQQWPYGEWPKYDRNGPFKTFGEAQRHLDRHHANPGGYSVAPLDGCKHDLLLPRESDKVYPFECDRCGKFLKGKPI